MDLPRAASPGPTDLAPRFLIAGFLLLVLSLLGAYLQRPSNNPTQSRTSWSVEPREGNVFLKLPTVGDSLESIHFYGPRLGWAVGDNGTILHTTDVGQTWQSQSNADKNFLSSIYGIGDGKTLWVVGLHGTGGDKGTPTYPRKIAAIG